MTQHQERHPSDQELLYAADGELPVRALAQVSNHLAECEACRERMSHIEGLLGRFVHLYREELISKFRLRRGRWRYFAPAYQRLFWRRTDRLAGRLAS